VNPIEHALALYGAGRCLNAVGKSDEAANRLASAREILCELHATPIVGNQTDRRGWCPVPVVFGDEPGPQPMARVRRRVEADPFGVLLVGRSPSFDKKSGSA
jgi:hypothetical protein